jgi:hypothetical protein
MNGEPHPERLPVPTPYLFIPYGPSDSGGRPVTEAQGYANSSIRVQVLGGRLEILTHPEVQLSCEVANSGPGAATAGIAEFYVGGAIGKFNPSRPTNPVDVKASVVLIGRARFLAPPGRTTTVACPKMWTGGGLFNLAREGVLVQVYDLFTDRLLAPFDALSDRHVARLDDPMPGVGQQWPGRPPKPPVFPVVI